jgi:hypothetical protein
MNSSKKKEDEISSPKVGSDRAFNPQNTGFID